MANPGRKAKVRKSHILIFAIYLLFIGCCRIPIPELRPRISVIGEWKGKAECRQTMYDNEGTAFSDYIIERGCTAKFDSNGVFFIHFLDFFTPDILGYYSVSDSGDIELFLENLT